SAEASSGNIRFNDTKGSLTLVTSFGNIKGEKIQLLSNGKFKASSGNITIDFLNEIKDLRFDLHAGSGTCSVEEGEHKKRSDKSLEYGSGSILISGTTTF